jgi:aminopeptidase
VEAGMHNFTMNFCCNQRRSNRRKISNMSSSTRDLIIGVKQTSKDGPITVSTTGAKVISETLASSTFITKNKWEQGKVRIYYVSDAKLLVDGYSNVQRIAFVGYSPLTKQDKIFEEQHLKEQFDLDGLNDQQIDVQNRARDAAAAGLKTLFDDDRELTVEVLVDDFDGSVQQAAEGAYLASHQFYLDEKKEKDLKKTNLSPLDTSASADAWNKGKIISQCQNFARWLEELPANYCTPIKFCEYASQRLQGTNVTVEIHDENWAKERDMNSYLSVSSGSDEPPRVFEAKYINNPNKKQDEIDLILVGKGVTFDSGGISIKPGPDMKLMKSDMGGSATVVATLLAIAQLQLPLNVIAITMMVENMINGKATRPGDVVTASNGKTIEIDNTDAEGRLALADGLVYASKYNPEYLIDMATLTGAIGVALGSPCAGLFSSTNTAWKRFEKAGYETNEFFWRMPLFRAVYKKQLKALSADLNNIGGAAGGSCTAAAFLGEFVDHTTVKHWVHLDIAKVVIPTPSECGTGRPTRAIIRFAENLSSK